MAPSPLPSRITKAAAGCLSLRILGFSGVERFGSLLVVAPWGLSLTRKLGCLLFHVGFSFDKAYVRGLDPCLCNLQNLLCWLLLVLYCLSFRRPAQCRFLFVVTHSYMQVLGASNRMKLLFRCPVRPLFASY
nr:uncharacterized protein LOC109773588 [Aegilops tauschii subsp. strangulata]